MAEFRFRLAPVLKLQEAARDERRSELAEAYRAEDALHARMRELDQALEKLKQECRSNSQPGVVDVDRLIDAQRYELLVVSQRQLLKQHELSLSAEIERRREALVSADREVRMLQKLREKQQLDHRQHEHRQEVKAMDEVAARMTEGKEV
jgi:flagellar export protein FliJ